METLIYLLKSSAILSLFLLVYEVFLKRGTHYKANRVFLLAGIFTAAILPYLTVEQVTFVTEVIPSSSVQEATTTSLPMSESVNALPQQPGFWELLDVETLLFGIYLTVTSLLLLRFLFGFWQLRHFLKKQNNYYFKNGIKYIQTNDKTGAYSIFKNIVYNPAIHTTVELELILKHEEAHVKHNHSVDMLLSNLLVFLNWFNPLAWLYRKRISQNLEFLADQAATADLRSPKTYQLSLLNYIKVKSSALPVNNFHKSFIKTRIKKLQQRKSKKYASLKIGLILPLLTVFYFVFQIDIRAETIYVEMKPTTFKVDTSEEKDSLITLGKQFVTVANGLKTGTEAASTNDLDWIKQVLIKDETDLVKVKIHKSTTEKSLKKIRRILKKMHQIEFNYSNLRFDNEKNLTQIEMSFTDQNGEGYHYSILGDNPIPEIELVVSKDFTGFKTFTNKDQSINRNSAVIINGKPDHHIDEELGEILRSVEKRKNNLKNEQVKTKDLIKSVNVIKNEDSGLIIINDQIQSDSLEQVESQEKPQKEVSVKMTFTIDANTTNKELEDIKGYFAKENFDFSYRVPRRNKKGEITKIKIKVEDGKGKKSSTAYQNKHGIDPFTISIKNGEFITD
ncbi:MAG TPA: M56 family metallopeptidase [Flavobacteriaceae bacterium]|nr:M56 family metallopeptidase [Flavobacteriaceae bacterium]